MSELGLIRTRALRQDVCRSHCLFLFLVSLSKSICYTKEARFTADFRFKSHSVGKYPHYHRPRINPRTGESYKSQGKKRHRPWEKKFHDKSFWDRF